MPETGDPIAELIAGLIAGDAPARRVLMTRYWNGPFRCAVRILRDEGEGHDLTASLMVDFMDRLVHGFRGRSDAALKAYLAASAISRATRRAGRSRRTSLTDPSELERLAGGDLSGPDDRPPSDPLLMARLEACLSKLQPRNRQILRLKYGKGLDNAEIGNLLGVTRAAISLRLADPRKGSLARLRRCVQRVLPVSKPPSGEDAP